MQPIPYRHKQDTAFWLARAWIALAVGLSAIQPAEAGSFLTTGALNNARYAHTATLLPGGTVLVAGGYGTNQMTSAELYDPAIGTWTMTGGLNDRRDSHTATLLPNGEVLVAGGEIYIPGVRTVAIASAELYDPTSQMWRFTGPLNIARASHTATLLPNGYVLVAGGETFDGTNYVSVGLSELYDPSTGTWTVNAALNVARQYHTATAMVDGRVLVVGGYNDDTGHLTSAELFDPHTGTWQPTGSLADARAAHSATLLPSGQVLVAGGATCCGAFLTFVSLSSAEIYDPIAGTWAEINPMNTARLSHTASLLPDGQVLVTGGLYEDGGFAFYDLTSTEEFDLVTGEWAWTGDLPGRTEQSSATLLFDGRLLLAGGANNYHALTDAELYEPDAVTSLATLPITATDIRYLANGSVRFAFTNTPGATFSVLATGFPWMPLPEWMVLGGVTETAPGQFQFTDPDATNYVQRFYRLRSP